MFELTPRELIVLELVAAGRTNRQIAAQLFVSPRTVDVHVHHILAKLDAANRVEAAGIAFAMASGWPAERHALRGEGVKNYAEVAWSHLTTGESISPWA